MTEEPTIKLGGKPTKTTRESRYVRLVQAIMVLENREWISAEFDDAAEARRCRACMVSRFRKKDYPAIRFHAVIRGTTAWFQKEPRP